MPRCADNTIYRQRLARLAYGPFCDSLERFERSTPAARHPPNGGTLTLDGTSVTGNTAANQGGGVENRGTLSCANGSTISGNDPDQCVDDQGGTGCAACATTSTTATAKTALPTAQGRRAARRSGR